MVPAEEFNGEASASIPGESYADEAGNRGSEGEDSIKVDTTAPTLEITSDKDTLAGDETTTLTFKFSEPVTGFTEGDIQVEGGDLVGDSLSTDDDETWTAEFTAAGGESIRVKVEDDDYTDKAGNKGSGDDHTINAAPVAENVTDITSVDKPIILDVLDNDSDPDGDDLHVAKVDGEKIPTDDEIPVEGGTVKLIEEGENKGKLEFTPETDPDQFNFADSNGQVTFDYTVSDGQGGTDTATVTVGVIDVSITDDAQPDGDGGDGVLASIDDLENVRISGQIPAGGSVVRLEVTDDAGGEVEVQEDDISIDEDDWTFSATANLEGLDDGTLTVRLEAKDSAENSATTENKIQKDTVTEVEITAIEADTADKVDVISGTGEPGATISLYQVAADGKETRIPGADSIQVVEDEDEGGKWSFEPGQPLEEELFEIKAKATDPWGNTDSDTRFVPVLELGDRITVEESGIAGDGDDQPAGTNPDKVARTDSGNLTFTFAENEDLKTLQIGENGESFDHDQLKKAAKDNPIDFDTDYGTLEITGYDDSGDTATLDYRFELTRAADHSEVDDDEPFVDSLDLRLTDTADDVRTGVLEIAIEDDAPSARDLEDKQEVTEGDDAFEGTNLLNNDNPGADGAVVHTVYYTNRDGDEADVKVGNAADVDGYVQTETVDTRYGELTVSSDGTWSYSVLKTVDHAGEDEVIESFEYDLIDGDGSVSENHASKDIQIADTEPEVGDTDDATVAEANLPSGTDPDPEGNDPRVTGKLDVSGNDPFLVSFDDISDEDSDSLYGEGFTAGGETVHFRVSDDGGTLTASTDQDFEEDGAEVFTVSLTDRKQSLDDARKGKAPEPGYEFTLKRPLDQAIGEEKADLPFDFTVQEQAGEDEEGYDEGKDSVSGSFTVSVEDDVVDKTRDIELDEDKEFSFRTPAKANDDTIKIKDGPEFGQSEEEEEGDLPDGIAIDAETGKITYTPRPDFSGEDFFIYRFDPGDGEAREIAVTVTVNPVSDEPDFNAAETEITVDEDPVKGRGEDKSRVALGFDAPVPSDQDKASAERLGAIELSDIREGAKLVLVDEDGDLIAGDGVTNGEIEGGNVEIDESGAVQFVIKEYLEDHTHIHIENWENKYPDAIRISKENFENLELRGPDHDATNFKVTGSVTSYEVDGSGNPLDPDDYPEGQKLKSSSEDSVNVTVLAVTDPVTLELNDDNKLDQKENIEEVDLEPEEGKATVTLKEDSPLDLSRLLTADFDDLTGSETRWIEISGAAEGTFVTVNDNTYTAGSDGDIEIPSSALGDFGDGKSRDLPTLELTPPDDFSGDISGTTITLKAQDIDPDEDDPDGDVEEDSVNLDLQVTPVPNEIDDLDQVEIDEYRPGEEGADQDGRVFLDGLEPGDVQETEKITKVVIEDIPKDWKIFKGKGGDREEQDLEGDNGGPFSLTIEDEDGIEDLGEYTIRAPEYRSEDVDLNLKVTVEDTPPEGSTVDDSVEGTFDVKLPIKVQPVAGTVEDGDVETPEDIAYDNSVDEDGAGTVGVKQDEWYNLNDTSKTDDLSGDDTLKTGWGNEDGSYLNRDDGDEPSETTYAQLTPNLVKGQGENADGVRFRWEEDGETREVAYNGTPVDVPVEFLDTLEMRAGAFQAGEFEVEVRAKTVDPGEEDDDTESEAVSEDGKYLLTGIVFEPNASDNVTLNISSTSGKESSQEETRKIDLDIDLGSADPYETFNITLERVPEGAKIFYDGDELDLDDAEKEDDGDGGLARGQNSVSIEDFNPSKDLRVETAPNDNRDFSLKLAGDVVDKFEGFAGSFKSIEDLVTRGIRVNVEGVADPASVDAIEDYQVTEESDAQSVSLNKLIDAQSLEMEDTDGSEKLTLRLEGLESDFRLAGEGLSSLGGTGTDRQWLLDLEFNDEKSIESLRDKLEGKLEKVELSIPEHFSGEVRFKLAPITTEDDGDSKTHDSTDVQLDVTPVPTADIRTSVTANEDEYQKLNFDLRNSPEVKNEELLAVRIREKDIDEDNFQLYLDSGSDAVTLGEAANNGDNGVTRDDGWLELTGDALTKTYVKGAPNVSADGLSFDVEYDIKASPWDEYDGDVDPVTDTFADDYSVTIEAVTDPVEMELTSVDNDSEATSVEVEENRSVDVSVRLRKEEDENADNQRDHDGSEKLEFFVIDNVPLGVTVEGGEFIGETTGTADDPDLTTGQWRLNVEETFEGGQDEWPVEQTIIFKVEGNADRLAGLDEEIAITAWTRDAAVNGQDQPGWERDTVGWQLEVAEDFNDDEANKQTPLTIEEDSWEAQEAEMTEDESIALGELVSGAFFEPEEDGSFSITLTDVPDGVTISGMTETTVDGEDVYYAHRSGGRQELENLLGEIRVQAQKDANKNNLEPGEFEFDATLTTYAPGGDEDIATTTIGPDVTIEPVTDAFELTVSVPSDAEEAQEADGRDGDVELEVSLSNPADGAFAQLLNADEQPADTVFVRLDDGGMDDEGALLWNGSEITETVFGEDAEWLEDDETYFVLDGVELNDDGKASLEGLTYRSAQYASGSVDVHVTVAGREENAENIETTSSSESFDIAPVNSGLADDFIVGDTSGLERDGEDRDDPIEIDVENLELNDESERVQAAFFEKVPNGYTVVHGEDAESASSASNAGSDGEGTNKWSIPVSQEGALPTYIAIKPPRYKSEKVEDIRFTVLSGEEGLEPKETSAEFDLIVEGVADGIDISPNPSFGDEGEPVRLNLNADMKDFSGSETATFEFRELGKGAAFYLPDSDTAELKLAPGADTSWAYDSDEDTYTVEGVPSDMINRLHVLQADSAVTDGGEVRGKTVEPNNFDDEVEPNEEPEFTASKDLRLEISPVTPSEGDDTLLYSGEAIDALGGKDTILLQFNNDLEKDDYAKFDNIEIFDLTNSGSNKLDALRPEDVLEMTDDKNLLEILGTDQDKVALKGQSEEVDDPENGEPEEKAVNWKKDSGADKDGFKVYEATWGEYSATVHIQSEIDVKLQDVTIDQ
ncbi:Ig-like domain-containing protein [Thioalkalivibrio sp. ALJ24]|uniref:Ig-like domain-containing protein n=1 Tax=Thioalkalivibrio sp. ALJ24 TaxID=545276 RepID=UPI00039DF796|nr:Ig-like domain-containing protein [Thioalkalivibrio sp. ALJ24]